MHKEKAGLFCFLFFFFFLSISSAAAGDLTLKTKPLNPAFVKYINAAKKSNSSENVKILKFSGEHPLGLIPNPIKLSPHKIKENSLLKSISLPGKYDLRDNGFVTPVRDQKPYGTCWAFATYGSLESDILKTEFESYDFSENNLVNGVFTRIGFYYSDNNTYGFNNGGNIQMSSAYLADGYGPVLESCDPYPHPGSTIQCKRTKYIENIVFLPPRSSPTDNDYLKEAVYNHGALYTSMYWCSDAYNSDNATYYYHEQSCSFSGAHAVVIVGWDDNKTVSNAPDKGAWIVKNSWGTDWGDNGYFYVSYYDTKFAEIGLNAYFEDKPDINGGDFAIYQYDQFGMYSSIGNVEHVYGANIFKASNSQTIKAVSFFADYAPTDYEIKVYQNCDNVSEIESLAPSAIQSGNIDEPGFYTINLNTPVNIEKDSHFVTEIELTPDNSSEYPLGIEYKVKNYSDNATCSKGESFISSDGTTWYDLCTYFHSSDNTSYSTNVCIKAIAVSANTNQPPVINSFTANPTSGDAPLKVFFNCNASDPDGFISSYEWDFDGDGIIDQTTSSGADNYTYNQQGIYTAEVTVEDNSGATTQKSITIKVNEPKMPKISIEPTSIDFGKIRIGDHISKEIIIKNTGSTVLSILNVSLSGQDADEFSYSNSCGDLSPGDNCSVSAVFNPEHTGQDLTAVLEIQSNDQDNATVAVSLKGTALNNMPPVAEAGKDQYVEKGSVVYLNGSKSYDPDNDTITYNWSIVSKPAGSNASLSDSSIANPTFTADVDGTYLIKLTVSDGILESSDNLTVTADDLTSEINNIAAYGSSTKINMSTGSRSLFKHSIKTSKADSSAVSGVSFPYGTLSFIAVPNTNSDNITIELYFSNALPGNIRLYKVDNVNHYTTISDTLWKKLDDHTLKLTLTDGGQFDLDGEKNGEIIDPIALGSVSTPKPASGGGGGGGGCAINPNMSFDPTLLLLILAAIGLYAFRRRT